MENVALQLDEHQFAEILTGAKRGERWAGERLFIDLQPRLLRFLRSAEPGAADDIAGDVWLSVVSGIGSFTGGLASFRSWVFVIARAKLADHRRRHGRRRTDPVDDVYFDDLSDSGDLADSMVTAMSAQAAIDLITTTLSEEQAEVVLLRVVADLDVAQVAEVLGRSANWVRVAQHRALRRLARRLEPHRMQVDVIPQVARAV